MTALTLDQEFSLMRLRFQRTLAVSIGLHVLLFAWLLVNRHWVTPEAPVVEITWLEQTPVAVPPKAKIDPAPVTEVQPASEPEVSVKDRLAANTAAADQVRQRLAALQPSPVAEQAISSLAQSVDLANTAPATMAPVVQNTTPTNLNRGTGTTRPAVALTRGEISSHRAPAAVAALSQEKGHGGGDTADRPSAAAGAVRNLGDATIKGTVADRRILTYAMPDYPAWATDEGVEAAVTLYFVVLPNGQVKEDVQVQRMASQRDFDRNAVAALRQWRFEPLSGRENLEQWGTITFRYRLKN